MTNPSIYDREVHTSISLSGLALLINRAVDVAISRRLKGLDMVHKTKEDRLLSIHQAADFFGVSVVTIHAWKKSDRLVGFKKIGGRVYIHESDCLKSLVLSRIKSNKEE